MPELKIRDQQSENAPHLGGSIFINNTSYSGADIKVVVNIYDKGNLSARKIKDLQDEIREVESTITSANGQLGQINAKLNRTKPGTSESNLYNKRAGILTRTIDVARFTIVDLQEQIRDLSKSSNTVSTQVLAEVQTISVSTHRDKQAVRSFGSVYPKAYTRGPRTAAGSLVFTVFDEHVLSRFLEAHATDFDATTFAPALLDQLPPVDILMSFANEYGSISRMALHGVEFIDEGQTMSIQDILTENIVQWVARSVDPMRSVANRSNLLDQNSASVAAAQGVKASDLILEEDYQTVNNELNPFVRFRRARNPFI